jgi:hypothetical protein
MLNSTAYLLRFDEEELTFLSLNVLSQTSMRFGFFLRNSSKGMSMEASGVQTDTRDKKEDAP